MTRYFIGLMVPPVVQQALTSFAQHIQATLPENHPYAISWTALEDLHCTLLYVGPTRDEERLEQAMRDTAAQLPPPTLSISGTTHWLGRNSLALAATGADQVGSRFVRVLAHLSSDARAGTRPFYGHVTLGRVRPVPDGTHDPFIDHEIEPVTWQASSVYLVKSRDKTAGSSRYQTVSRVPFGG